MFGLPLEQIIFLVLSGLSIVCSLGLVIFKDPVHSAVSLVLTFFNVAGIYILMGAEFMAALQVLVYSGAILVLFVFVMMLLQLRPGPALNPFRFFQSRIAPVIALAFLAEVLVIIFASNYYNNGGKITDSANTQAANMAKNISYVVSSKVPMTDTQGNSVVKSNEGWFSEPNSTGHTALLGKELYSKFILPFEICSLILLVAAIGAIVIGRRGLERDRKEFRSVGISLGGVAEPGSAQEFEYEKELKMLGTNELDKERKLTLKK
ncbi:NADH-quinone oxidoreductase subunit J [Candidatus Chlorohelix sp.]|uniref:NADH-quinone oxidoreductase subunit J family protein n=1 Tax=Candidatus Chlorohelix sp. TaxID=3139201 RepID=UPI0030441D6E